MSVVTVKDIAHDVHRDNPHLGNKGDIEHLIKGVFDVIMERVAKGQDVRVRGFGTFSANIFKGRTLKSPLLENGEIEFGDQLVLRFRQSQAAKKRVNEIANETVEEPPKKNGNGTPKVAKKSKAKAKKTKSKEATAE